METGQRVLVVDDETSIRRYLRAALTAQGLTVYEAANGQEALNAVIANRPDIIILSVREAEQDKIAALDAGADDYLTKPFSTGELMARIRVVMRRQASKVDEPILHVDELQMDLSRRVVNVRGDEISLTPTEYDILRLLMQNAGKVITHHHLLRQVWGTAYENEMHILRVNISNLRRKIERDPTRPGYIHTEPGVGYRMRADSGKKI